MRCGLSMAIEFELFTTETHRPIRLPRRPCVILHNARLVVVNRTAPEWRLSARAIRIVKTDRSPCHVFTWMKQGAEPDAILPERLDRKLGQVPN
jgi:hypothetical protein